MTTHSSSRAVALVTGGSRGIGLGIALELAGSGFDLAINGRRAAADVDGVLAQLRSAGADVLYCQADVADCQAHAPMLEQIERHFGRLDVLVNNAGIAPPVRADILEAGVASFDQVMSTNLRGPYFLTQSTAKWMIRQRAASGAFRGRIINVSSISATVASINRGDYCLSKAAVAMATQLWAARLAEHGIDVFEVRPGIIETDMTAPVKQKYDSLIAGGLTLEKRWGTPADVGGAVAVLASGRLQYATGQVLVIDGGLTLARL